MLKGTIMKYMRELLGITGADAEELFDCYVETLQELCQKLESAVEQRNVMEIRSVTHSIAGSSTNIGADIVAEHAIAINAAAKSNDFEEVESLLSKLKTYPAMLRE